VAFITLAEVEIDLSSLTTRRLLDHDGDGIVDPAGAAQRCEDACVHVVSLVHGYKATVPSAADAPAEWKRLARRWFLAQLAIDFAEYFRFDGQKMAVAIDREIVAMRNVEPAENKTYTKSIPLDEGEDWT